MTWETDAEYEEHVLDKVEKTEKGYVLGYDSWCLYVNDPGFEPKVGETARYYGRGIGFLVRGVVVEGRVVYYRTPEEQEAKNEADHQAERRRRQDAFLKNKSEMDARFAALPLEFQRRIERFRNHCSSFRWEYEGYEMSSCVDAVKIAAHLKPTATGDKDAIWNVVKSFGALPYEEQRRLIPDLDGGHSGNTWGMAVRLAYRYLAEPETVEKEHAAISALVGCAACGCWHPENAA